MRKTFPHQLEVTGILLDLARDHENGKNVELHTEVNDWIDSHLPENVAEKQNWDHWCQQDWLDVYNLLVRLQLISGDNVWMAVNDPNKSGMGWDKQEQTYLGCIPWDTAVQIAKSQDHATRLSNSAGFNNQGHYFHPA